MKKLLIIGAVVAAAVLLVAGLAIPALAHSGDDDVPAGGAFIDGPTLTRVADALGLTTGELTAELQSGQTLAEIAADNNVPEDTVIDAIVAPYAAQIQLQVSYGYLTQDQADTMLANARTNAENLLDQQLSGTPQGNADFWEEMEEYCDGMMDDYGYGMGPGMMGGDYGSYRMGPGMMGGDYGSYGPGYGMMGPGYGYNYSAPDQDAPTVNSGTGFIGRMWNGITGGGNSGYAGGGMMGGGSGGGMMGGW